MTHTIILHDNLSGLIRDYDSDYDSWMCSSSMHFDTRALLEHTQDAIILTIG